MVSQVGIVELHYDFEVGIAKTWDQHLTPSCKECSHFHRPSSQPQWTLVIKMAIINGGQGNEHFFWTLLLIQVPIPFSETGVDTYFQEGKRTTANLFCQILHWLIYHPSIPPQKKIRWFHQICFQGVRRKNSFNNIVASLPKTNIATETLELVQFCLSLWGEPASCQVRTVC